MSDTTTSPMKPQAGSLHNYSSNFKNTRETSRAALQLDLERHVEYDVDVLPWYLRMRGQDSVLEDVVNSCLNNVNYQNAITALKSVVHSRRRDEIAMYRPLVNFSMSFW